ncbi:MAG TPA: YHYH protein [Gemmatimonadaceae bacterium]|nr:YHYH protein [Gemmatimonadaceae bacterium]
MRANPALLMAFAVFACASDSAPTSNSNTNTTTDTTSTTDTTHASTDLPALYKAFGNGVVVTVSGGTVVITSNGLPDHKSPYWGTGNAMYEAYNGSNAAYVTNPNRIRTQQLTFRIPLTPTALTTPSPTPLGPIGVAINGVPIFNQYAANNQPLTGEINSFDQYNGHPQMTGMYHYHVEPTWLTRATREALVGVLLDGYPVYGPMENGALVATSSLDAAHGHFGVTKEFPGGVYHYHTTSDAPYINGSGFHGSPGTVAQ